MTKRDQTLIRKFENPDKEMNENKHNHLLNNASYHFDLKGSYKTKQIQGFLVIGKPPAIIAYVYSIIVLSYIKWKLQCDPEDLVIWATRLITILQRMCLKLL